MKIFEIKKIFFTDFKNEYAFENKKPEMDKIKYFHKNEIEKDLKFMDDDFHNKVKSKITKKQNDYRGRRYKEEFFL